MLRYLTPRLYFESVFDITPDVLKERGILAVILDLDNTLVAWNTHDVDDRLREWLDGLQNASIRCLILSNNSAERVRRFTKEVDLPWIASASKPRRRAYRQALEILGTSREETAVIGDQVFTDVLGGNRAGLFTILVKPVGTREFFGTRLVRKLERYVLRRLAMDPVTKKD